MFYFSVSHYILIYINIYMYIYILKNKTWNYLSLFSKPTGICENIWKHPWFHSLLFSESMFNRQPFSPACQYYKLRLMWSHGCCDPKHTTQASQTEWENKLDLNENAFSLIKRNRRVVKQERIKWCVYKEEPGQKRWFKE